MNPKRPTSRHVIIEMTHIKERILKAAGEKRLAKYKSTLIRPSADFPAETLQSWREWHDKSRRYGPGTEQTHRSMKPNGGLRNEYILAWSINL